MSTATPATDTSLINEPLGSPAGEWTASYSGHLPVLDGLRGIAILAVIVYHYAFELQHGHGLGGAIYELLHQGRHGVDLFFVLSGFLITGILLDTRESPRYFRTFYARRILRIFPLYFFYLAAVALLLTRWWTSHFGYNPWAGVSFWPYFLYFENFKSHHMFNDLFLGHLWSLAVEEQFYTVWPLLVALMPRRLLGWTAMGFVCFAVIYRFCMVGKSLEVSFFVNTFTVASLDSLALGALTAMLLRT